MMGSAFLSSQSVNFVERFRLLTGPTFLLRTVHRGVTVAQMVQRSGWIYFSGFQSVPKKLKEKTYYASSVCFFMRCCSFLIAFISCREGWLPLQQLVPEYYSARPALSFRTCALPRTIRAITTATLTLERLSCGSRLERFEFYRCRKTFSQRYLHWHSTPSAVQEKSSRVQAGRKSDIYSDATSFHSSRHRFSMRSNRMWCSLLYFDPPSCWCLVFVPEFRFFFT